jgi:signal transduction histidine kinase
MSMLHEFLTANRDELVGRCREKVLKRSAPRPTEAEVKHGVPEFLEQLIRTLRVEEKSARSKTDKVSASSQEGRISGASEPGASPSISEIGKSATKHGDELLQRGFTVDQVVHDYGDLCQSITELAGEKDAMVTVDEFRTLNRCLDNATADAVTEFGRQREQHIADEGTRAGNERLGIFAHELRNLLTTTTLAISAIKRGNVGIGGATGGLLDRSMVRLRALIDRSLVDVRLTAGIPLRRERVSLADFLEEVAVTAALEADARGLELTVGFVDGALAFDADRQILASAVSNLLSNAIKFTHEHGRVSLRAHETADRILIEVEDECGGLPDDKVEALFHPFEQQSSDRTGLGLGLSISRRGVEANGGALRARSIAGKGCVFTVDLPKPSKYV